jgi:hypothetical protein
VQSRRLRIGDPVRLWFDPPEGWEVVEVRKGVGDEKLTYARVGVNPSRVRWVGTVICRLVEEHS